MSTTTPTGPNAGNFPLQPRNPTKLYLDPKVDAIDFTFYQTNVQGLVSTSPNGTSQIQIDAGTDFYWVASSYQADVGGAAQTESGVVIPLVTVVINDTASQRQLMNNPVPLSAIAGPGERPYRLLLPRLFRAQAVIQFTWASYVAAGTTYANIYFIMHGFRLPAGAAYNL